MSAGAARRFVLPVLVALLGATGAVRTVQAQEAGAASDPVEAPRAEAAPQPAGQDSLVRGSGMTPEELDALTARVAAQLRCPVCRNQSVLESSATLSQEMQAEIRRRLASGDSPREVRAYFVDRYGEWILLRPKAEGLNLLVYVLPAVALLLGGFVVWRLLLRWSGASAEEEAEDARTGDSREAETGDRFRGGLDPEEEERLEAALRGEDRGGGP